MRSASGITARTLRALLAFALAFAPHSLIAQRNPDDAARRWAEENLQRVVNDLFSLEARHHTGVTYRDAGDSHHNVLDTWFRIGWPPDRLPLQVVVRIADGASVFDQLIRLYQANPTAPLIAQLKIRTWTLTKSNCPAVAGQWESLQRLAVLPLEQGVLRVDARAYHFSIESFSDSLRLITTDESQPLVHWAKASLIEFARCIDKLEAAELPPGDSQKLFDLRVIAPCDGATLLMNHSSMAQKVVAARERAVPALIASLTDESYTYWSVFCDWGRTRVADVAFFYLRDLFSYFEPESMKTHFTIPEARWDDLPRMDHPLNSGAGMYLRYLEEHPRASIQKRWQAIWEKYRDRVEWDDADECFRLKQN